MATLPGLRGMMQRTLGAPQKAMPYWFTFGPFLLGGYPSTQTWVCPFTTIWRFVLWGGGSGGYDLDVTGGSGAGLLIAERPLRAGDRCIVNVAAGGNGGGSTGPDTLVTLPTGEILKGPGGNTSGTPAPPPKTNPFDVLLPWSGVNIEPYAPWGDNPGERGIGPGGLGQFYRPCGNGAAGQGPYRGGNGGGVGGPILSGMCPGGGGATIGGVYGQGGDGMAIIHPVEGAN